MAEKIDSIQQLRKQVGERRNNGKTVGLVPTMGALHLGHRRLIEQAHRDNDCVIVTIFVNPTQFDRKDDLDRYPRTLDADMALCTEAGAEFVFVPSAEEIYPQEQLTWVDVPALDQYLCGPGRPGHFRGVATVVMKLLQIAQADRAYFGEKDAQQLAIIRRMVRDLNVPVEIVPVPTVREPDGLAMSSRNKHLSPAERELSVVLSQALFAARDQIQAGERSVNRLMNQIRPLFPPAVQLEYFSFVDPEFLLPIEKIGDRVLIAAAMWVGKTRLIDNITVLAPASSV
jgi:pantoate--beta-alanine ligase